MKLVSRFLVAALAASAASCDSSSGSTCGADFGATAQAQRIEAFLDASATWVTTADALDADLRASCLAMARDLQLSTSAFPTADMPQTTQTICNAVVTEIRSTLTAVRGSATVTVESVPPVCEISVDAYAACAAECDVNVQPGNVDLMCQGGELRGQCSASCTGSCAVNATATCTGRCEGTCSGSCTGVCNGICNGTCSARAADGSCAGSCTGECQGSCSAGCTGTCTGDCVTNVSGSCTGECRGSCSVEFVEPYCTGTVDPPMVDASCEASCNARAAANVNCTPGEVRITATGSLDAATQARFDRVRTAVQGHLGDVREIEARFQKLASATATLSTTATTIPSDVASLTAAKIASATSCIADAAQSIQAAVPQVSVSVQVSVQVSGSVYAN